MRKDQRFAVSYDPRPRSWLLYLGWSRRALLVLGWHRERIAGVRQRWAEITFYTSERIGPRRYKRLSLELQRRVAYLARRGPYVGIVAGPGHFTFDIGWRWW